MSNEKGQENEGGIKINNNGLSCFACKCKRKNLIKDKKKIIDEKE